MDGTLAIFLPSTLLFAVVAGYLLTVFEPYFAYANRSDEAVELINYHSSDRKLHLIAESWSANLSNPPLRWYQEDHESARLLKEKIIEALVRHRFIFGDDPRKLEHGKSISPVLRRALTLAGQEIPEAEQVRKMLIAPNIVKMTDGAVIWRGRPLEYKTRFCDFYPEP